MIVFFFSHTGSIDNGRLAQTVVRSTKPIAAFVLLAGGPRKEAGVVQGRG